MRLYIVHLSSFWMELYSHTHTHTATLCSRIVIETSSSALWTESHSHQHCEASHMIKTITMSSRWKTCAASGERMAFHTEHFPMMHCACAYACVGLCKDVDQEEHFPTTAPDFSLGKSSLSLSLSLALAWKSRAAKTSGIGYYIQYIASRKRF